MTSQPQFQAYCYDWLRPAFGHDSEAYAAATSVEERARRFGEEAIELLQASKLTLLDVIQLAAYVYGRPTGEVNQEIGGTLVTLASLASSHGLDMMDEGWREIKRCYTPEVMEKIRKKQVSKQLHGIGGTPSIPVKDNLQRFPDGTVKPFLSPEVYDSLRDDDRFLYNRAK